MGEPALVDSSCNCPACDEQVRQDEHLSLPDGVPPLRSIYYYPTGSCNLRCKHCWVDPKVEQPGGDPWSQRDRAADELTAEQFFGIVEEAKELGLKHVKFTGGEPLLRRDTIDLMEGCAERGLGLTLETNGTLLDEQTAERLAKLPINVVAVSIDSTDAEYHDRFRGVRGAHERAMRGAKFLVEASCNVQIIAAICRGNVGQCEAIVRLGREMGVSSVKLNPITPTGRAEAFKGTGDMLSARQVLDLYTRFARDSSQRMHVHVEVPPAFRPVSDLKRTSLCRIKMILGLLASGDVAYCGIGMSCPEMAFDNVLRTHISTVWTESHQLLMLRSGLPSELRGVCSRCVLKRYCLGRCVVANYVEGGSVFASYWVCRDAEKEGLFPRSRLA